MNDRLTMQDLVSLLANKHGIKKKDAEFFLHELFAVIYEMIEQQDSVRIKSFGTFKLIKINARKSVDVNTGEDIEIPEHFRLSFIPDKILRDAVNKPFAHFESVVIEEGACFENIDIVHEIDAEEDSEIISTEPIDSEPISINPQISSIVKEDVLSDKNSDEVKAEEPDESGDNSFSQETVPIGKDPIEREKNSAGWIIMGIIIVTLLICTYIYYSDVFLKNTSCQTDVLIERSVAPLSDSAVSEQFTNQPETLVENNHVEKEYEPKGLVKVKYGDTLRNMGLRFYGHKSFWVYIYQENINKISDFNNVTIGTLLVIPANEKYGIDVNNPESIKEANKLEKEYFKK